MTAANNLPVDTPPFPLNTTFKYNSFVLPVCREQEPPLEEIAPGHFNACHRAADVEEIRARSREEETWVKEAAA